MNILKEIKEDSKSWILANSSK